MFVFGKNKLLRKMEALVSVAQMAVYLSLLEENKKSMDGEVATKFSAAVANYLFGKGADQRHIEEFTIKVIESTGNNVIKINERVRELVIQSLRVISTVYVEAGKEEVGLAILSTYGNEYPQPPDPISYPELVQASIQGMSPNVQQLLFKMRR